MPAAVVSPQKLSLQRLLAGEIGKIDTSCRSGEIGIHVRFRSVCQKRGGSSPSCGTKIGFKGRVVGKRILLWIGHYYPVGKLQRWK